MDTRSKKNIETLHPVAQKWARAFLQAITDSNRLPEGVTVRIISGNRTWAEQDALFAQGRTKPGNVVTNARGGQSNHNFGIAWDIGIFINGKYQPSSPWYDVVGEIGEGIGLEWGGRWTSIQDKPHYQVRTGLTTAAMRAIMRAGKAITVSEPGKAAPTETRSDKVTIYDGDKKTDIMAYNEGGRIFVELRRFVNQFGGEVLATAGMNFTVELNDQKVSIAGVNKHGIGYAKFADINRITDWSFRYEAGNLYVESGE
jgi:peptidoglycan L-alanyl-D-glutamate endopeptidase CwlK